MDLNIYRENEDIFPNIVYVSSEYGYDTETLAASIFDDNFIKITTIPAEKISQLKSHLVLILTEQKEWCLLQTATKLEIFEWSSYNSIEQKVFRIARINIPTIGYKKKMELPEFNEGMYEMLCTTIEYGSCVERDMQSNSIFSEVLI